METRNEIERLQMAVHRLANEVTALVLRLDLLEREREREKATNTEPELCDLHREMVLHLMNQKGTLS
jgi:hypothetical protein